MPLATNKKSSTLHPSSFRFQERTNDRLNYYAKVLKRKKISLVDEALNRMFDEEEKKENEDSQLLELLKKGDESGRSKKMLTLQEIESLAKERHSHT